MHWLPARAAGTATIGAIVALAHAQVTPRPGCAAAPGPDPPPAAALPDAAPRAESSGPLRLAAIDTSVAAFRKLDTDHDGRISALEANSDPKVAERFLEADKNHDGYLSLAEFKTLSNSEPEN